MELLLRPLQVYCRAMNSKQKLLWAVELFGYIALMKMLFLRGHMYIAVMLAVMIRCIFGYWVYGR